MNYGFCGARSKGKNGLASCHLAIDLCSNVSPVTLWQTTRVHWQLTNKFMVCHVQVLYFPAFI